MKPVSSRKRWAPSAATDKRRSELRVQARNRINEAADPNRRLPEIVGLHLVRECDLRATLEEKSLSVHQLAKWTAFVNRAGTLVHILPKEGDFHVRLPMFYAIGGLSDRRIESLLWGLMEGRFK